MSAESTEISPNTGAILLLTAPLIVNPRAAAQQSAAQLLSQGEYRKLAGRLHALSAEPADLLESDGPALVPEMSEFLDGERLRRLLDRGFLLAQAADRWRARSIWVVSRGDQGYPQRAREILKSKAPPVLYGCGEPSLLRGSGLAIVGSRNADDGALGFARDAAARVAATGRAVVSGGARGVDRAAMSGAIEHGGRAVGVLADRLERTSMNREHRNWLLEERLALVSPYDPQAGFHVGQAMQRNKLIYALADAGLVVDAAPDEGGTWAGAIEQLEVYRRPLFVRSATDSSEGLRALWARGAQPWPDNADEVVLEELLCAACRAETRPDRQATLPDFPSPNSGMAKGDAPADGSMSEELFETVRTIVIRLCIEPKSGQDIAETLDVPKAAADRWLKRLVEEKAIAKETRPVRYTSRQCNIPGLR